MSQSMSYYCDACKRHINALDTPVVLYVVAGHVTGGAEIESGKLHPGIEALMKQPIARREWCHECAPKGLADLLATPLPEPEPGPQTEPQSPMVQTPSPT